MIKLYLPIHNSASFLEKVEIPSQFDVMVVDAYSTDRSVEIAEARGWSVDKLSKKNSRVENWQRAVNHFVHSQSQWCKWLFTGDSIVPDAHNILMNAILKVPQAKLIICEYDIVSDNQRTRWKMFSETQLLSPPQTAWLTAKLGNWFGSPIGQCFHRDAVVEGFSFGPWTWAADMQFCYNIAKRWPVLYVAESVGEFHVKSRKTFSSQCNALNSSVEEYLVRVQAARDYLHLTEDHAGYEELNRLIIQETESVVISRSFQRATNNAEAKHIFDSIPLKQLCRGLIQRVLDKLCGR